MEIHTISELQAIVPQQRSTDLIFFDIDYTLTEPTHPVLQMSTIKQNKQRFRDELAKLSPEQQSMLPVIMVTLFPNQLTDPAVPNLLKQLQCTGATVLGFTAINTSSIKKVGDVPAWRVKELSRLGIAFFPNTTYFSLPKERTEFKDLPSYRGSYPLFQNGILYSNVTPSKGAVLGAFLDKIPQKPTKVVFVDDSIDNLNAVSDELAKRRIPFTGYHYKIPVGETVPFTDEEWEMIWQLVTSRLQ